MFDDSRDEHEDTPITSLQAEVEYLRQENQRLTQRLKETQLLVDIHREASQILSLMLDKKRFNLSNLTSKNFEESLIGQQDRLLPSRVM